MSNSQKQKLHKIISKGKWNFILLKGVVVWGLLTAVFSNAIQYYNNGGIYPENMWLSFIIFPIGGLAWGHYMWLYFNNKYQKLVHDEL